METIVIYVTVSVLLLAFSGLCGVLLALCVSWYQVRQRAECCARRAARRGSVDIDSLGSVVDPLVTC